MKALFDDVSVKTSKLITQTYSTSFSLGVKLLAPSLHNPIYAIYGFVRLADEIVDSFHQYDKQALFDEFKTATYKAIEQKISLNPVLNNFQQTVHQYNIEEELIDTFLKSMEMDLKPYQHSKNSYDTYILGSAEVVGLMCLKVFVNGNTDSYNNLKHAAMKLGAAFQKINFLRDYADDTHVLGRKYFPQLNTTYFNDSMKQEIEQDVANDFKAGYEGIKRLPKNAQLGVYVAYIYYYKLFKKITKTSAQKIQEQRVRIPDSTKYRLLLGSYLKHRFNLL